MAFSDEKKRVCGPATFWPRTGHKDLCASTVQRALSAWHRRRWLCRLVLIVLVAILGLANHPAMAQSATGHLQVTLNVISYTGLRYLPNGTLQVIHANAPDSASMAWLERASEGVAIPAEQLGAETADKVGTAPVGDKTAVSGAKKKKETGKDNAKTKTRTGARYPK